MIYLITGVPGSGKTLYAVSTLLQSLAKEKIVRRGVQLERRICVDNIKDLIIPHVMLAALVENDKGELVKEDPDANGVWNWPQWCVPGDVIVIDEVQRHWRPRGMGTKPPPEIQALETHRHMGVDFVIVTQNPMLIDQNVRRLVGRHQHIRRLWGMARAAIYDWDGCSVDVHRIKSATTSYWSYPKDAYKLYKSSELHTKQKQNIPVWLAVPLLAVVAAAFVAPTAYATLSGAMTGKGVSSKVAPGPVVKTETVVTAGPPVLPAAAPGPVALSVVPPFEEVIAGPLKSPEVAGCIVVRDRCGCFDAAGKNVKVEKAFCTESVASSELPASKVESMTFMSERVYKLPEKSSDVETLADLRDLRQRGKKTL